MQLSHATNLIVLFHEKQNAFPTVSKSNNLKILDPLPQLLVLHGVSSWTSLLGQPAVSKLAQRAVPVNKRGMPLRQPTETQNYLPPRLPRESHCTSAVLTVIVNRVDGIALLLRLSSYLLVVMTLGSSQFTAGLCSVLIGWYPYLVFQMFWNHPWFAEYQCNTTICLFLIFSKAALSVLFIALPHSKTKEWVHGIDSKIDLSDWKSLLPAVLKPFLFSGV